MRWRALLIAGLVAVGVPATAQDGGLTTVVMGDGSSLMLRSWQLVYDAQTWPKGQPPSVAGSLSVPATELWSAKKRHPLARRRLEPIYSPGTFVARQVALVGPDGKKQTFVLEQPARELLTPELEKGTLSMARSVDLVGETLTGTKRSFCLLSYTALVTCSDSPENQVVRVEFAP